jgi:hypothetical protein
MSELTLNVLDERRSLHGRIHGSDIDRLVASLGADPETIEELQLAAGRFTRVDHSVRCWPGFTQGSMTNRGTRDVYIDLTARLVCSQSTYSAFIRAGQELWHNGDRGTDEALPFHLADDWLLSDHVDQFQYLSRQRRTARAAQLRIDERAVLFGRLPELIVLALHARREQFAQATEETCDDLIRQVHADWLLTPREDLHGRAPRDVMLDERHHHVDMDVQGQQPHWSMLRRQPPTIPRESAAYRLGGFGTNEIVLYYDLVRDMLWEAAGRWRGRTLDEAALPAEAEHLQKFRQDWLHLPNPEFHGRTAASIIDKERRRLPNTAGGDEAVVDPDCDCCEMLADEEQFGPMFWSLDGCNMDDDFAFRFTARVRVGSGAAEMGEVESQSLKNAEIHSLDDSPF